MHKLNIFHVLCDSLFVLPDGDGGDESDGDGGDGGNDGGRYFLSASHVPGLLPAPRM